MPKSTSNYPFGAPGICRINYWIQPGASGIGAAILPGIARYSLTRSYSPTDEAGSDRSTGLCLASPCAMYGPLNLAPEGHFAFFLGRQT